MLYYIIYMSRATWEPEQDELDQILKTSANNNKEADITGMLLYVDEKNALVDGGRFIQVLEGPENKVRPLYEKLKLDPRHHQITELFSYNMDKRNFSDWSMGFKRVDSEEVPEDMKQWFNPDDFPAAKSNANGKINIPLTYLRSFYEMHRPTE